MYDWADKLMVKTLSPWPDRHGKSVPRDDFGYNKVELRSINDLETNEFAR
jgi:hypothetical protein